MSRTELNQQTARVLARVARGERLVITDRGRPVAELVPAAADSWNDLDASGAVTPAPARGPLSFDAVKSDVTSEEMLADIRADRS